MSWSIHPELRTRSNHCLSQRRVVGWGGGTPVEKVYGKVIQRRWHTNKINRLIMLIEIKKTLKCCCTCTSRVLILWRHDVIYVSSRRHWHHVTTSHMSWRHTKTKDFLSDHSNKKTLQITFFHLVTLTFDLWPSPSNSFDISQSSIPVPNFVTVRQSVQPWER